MTQRIAFSLCAAAMIAALDYGAAVAQDAAVTASESPQTWRAAVPSDLPIAPEAAPAEPVEAAVAEPAPPPPVLPTTGDGAAITRLLTNICKPVVVGKADFEKLAKAEGMKLDRRNEEYTLQLAQKPYQVAMRKPSENNPNVCEIRVRYAPGWDAPIIESLNIWRFLQDPQLHGQRSDIADYSDVQRVTTTWDNWENQMIDGKMIGLVLVQLNKRDGTTSTNPNYDDAIVQYQVRAAEAAEGVATTAATPDASPTG